MAGEPNQAMARGTQNARLVTTRYRIVWFASHICIQANLVLQAVEARLESKPWCMPAHPACVHASVSQALHYHLNIIIDSVKWLNPLNILPGELALSLWFTGKAELKYRSVEQGQRKVVNSGGGLISQQEKISMVKSWILWRTLKIRGGFSLLAPLSATYAVADCSSQFILKK